MIGDLQGGSTPEAAKKQLMHLGSSGWTERTVNNTSLLAVRFSDLGVSGALELSFYNDRLMVAQFEPDNPGRYWDLLSARLGKLLPQAANQTGKINKDVTLGWNGSYSESGAKTRYRWGYLPVLKEWQTSLGKRSSIFVFQPCRNS
jgi:hypothetical protein